MRSWSYVPVGVAFNIEDTDGDRDDRLSNYGLYRANGDGQARGLAGGAFSTCYSPHGTDSEHLGHTST